ncbi:MAG: ferredoxin family protein [Lachnospiraceae bacterium]|nr:ferredoxin family protein [Lachnospiraceae bacterium]
MTEYSFEPVKSSVSPIRFDEERCIRCNRCVEACQIDVLIPAGQAAATPFAAWPGECWYCGACVMECPVKGAITLQHPLMNRAKFVPVIHGNGT